MIHKVIFGNSNRTIIGLHGTGGTEEDMIQIAHYLDPEAMYIGIRGNVVEAGMNRYFKRIDTKTFDISSLNHETEGLYREILKLLNDYQRPLDQVSIIGYSNGANITLNMMKKGANFFKQVILFHPMHVQPHLPFPTTLNTRIFLTSGSGDPYTERDDIEFMSRQLKDLGMSVTHFHTAHGHQLVPEEIKRARDFYEI